MSIAKWLLAKKLSGGGSPFPPVIKRVTGNPIELTDAAAAPMVKCVTEIQGSQDLHGYDKPWVGGAGKNKLPLVLADIKSANTDGTWNGNAYTINGITFTVVTDDNGNISKINANGTPSTTTVFFITTQSGFDGSFKLNGSPTGGSGSTWKLDCLKYPIDGTVYGTSYDGDSNSFNLTTSMQFAVRIVLYTGAGNINIDFQPMIRLASVTDSTFEPYSNICPITAYTEGEIEVSDGVNSTTHTTTYPSAIYRGSEDVVNGELENAAEVYSFTGNETIEQAAGNPFVFDIVAPAPFNINIGEDIARPWSHFVGVNYKTSANMLHGEARQFLRGSTVYFSFCNHNLTSVSDCATWLAQQAANGTPVQLVPKKLPTTSSVTPTNLPIRTLSGYNHIESSTGNMVIDYITDAYQNFVDTVENALPNTRKGGVKAMDVFLSLEKKDDDKAEVEKEAVKEEVK